MIEQEIKKLFNKLNLGEVTQPIETVSGGFMHRMYKVCSNKGTYAVKYLNPEVMSRPDAMGNYMKAEGLERILEESGIPMVPALSIDGKKMQEMDGHFFYIFDWLDGNMTDWDDITDEQCYLAGSILGRIHAIEPKEIESNTEDENHVDWDKYVSDAEVRDSEIYQVLSENIDILKYAEAEMNKARKNLPAIECISDEDMEILKNVDKIDNYGDSSFFPVFGGKLKGYSGKPGTEEI